MPTLSVRDYKTLQKYVVTTIVEIMDRNPGANLDHICEAMEGEIKNLRALKQQYFDQLVDSPEIMEAALKTKSQVTLDKTSSLRASVDKYKLRAFRVGA